VQNSRPARPGSRGTSHRLASDARPPPSPSLSANPKKCYASSIEPGDTIVRRFQIEREIGAGGMGTVFSARDLETGAKVAVKRLDIRTKNDAERFAREAVVLAELNHPGIVRYVAHGQTERGEDFIAMEWLEGKTLADRLVEGSLSLVETVQLGTRIASALAEAHRRNIVHRDIKPPNLFLPDGDISRVKLLDFGVARVTGLTNSTMTRTGALIGTPGYMAPEQARGEKELDARADLFSLGSVLFQCLTGKPPFSGTNIMAVLAKILLEEAPRVRELRPEVPASLDDLIARLLAKDPNGRPRDVEEVGALLSAISFGDLQADSPYFPAPSREPSTKPPSLTDSEQRVLCVVLAGDLEGTGDTWTPASAGTGDLDVDSVVRDLGGQMDPLVDGSTLIHFAGSGNAIDLAVDAARCALALKKHFGGTPVVLATGRGEVSRRMPVGEVIDRAARTLEAAAGNHVRIDAVSAGLVELKFEVGADASGWFLAREKESVAGARTLLGKPTKLVGRDRELAMLEATFSEVVEEPVARAVLISAPPGMGKSRLVHEFLERRRGKSVAILAARGDAHRSNAPFGMLAGALRREAGIAEGEAVEAQREKLAERIGRHLRPEDAKRITAFIGEIVNIAFSDEQLEALRAARADAMLMGDSMRAAWLDWLGAELEQAPVLLLLEELHWCDLPTVRFVDAALKTYAEASLMVLALARPSVKERFPKLWAGADPIELNLGALTKRATEKLILQVLEDAPARTVELIVERGEGNPFIVEELVRAVAAGREGELPDSVLGMIQARLDDLGPAGKRVLRAASVFGNTFWRGGVLALLGGSESTSSVSEWLDDLVQREIIVRSTRSTFPGEIEFHFGNASVRDAAYAMLTDRDRRLGHRLAGTWLESSGQRDAIVLAGHFDRGGEDDRAIGFYLRAAEQALEGNDFATVIHCAQRGVGLGAQLEVLGKLELSRAIAHYWLGEVGETAAAAEQASLHLPQGSPGWFRAVGEVLSSLLRSGDLVRLEEWIDRAATAIAARDAINAQVICLARTAEHLLLLGHYALSEKLFAKVDAVAGDATLEPLALARVYRGRARRALHHGDPGTYAVGLAAANQTFEQAGDLRNACNERMNMGFALSELGEYEKAKEALESARQAAERMNLEHVVAWADNNLGNVLALSDPEAARRVEQRAIDAGVEQKDPRLEGTSRIYMSGILHRLGDLQGALRESERAVELLGNLTSLKTVALAAEARALLALRRNDEALEAAEEAMQHLLTLGGLEEGEALVRLVYAETLDAADREEEAKAAAQTARDRLFARAARISNVAWRVTFLERVPDHARTLDLARALGLDDLPTLRD
jgi:serine/threonine protein kinase/tetratricopeptide (TPR) repeat protein